MYFPRQSFLVYGISRSGIAAANFLLRKEASVFVYDDKQGERVQKTVETLVEGGAKSVKSEEAFSLAERLDALVLSPGIPIDHPLAVAFKRNRKLVLGESELAARALRSPVLAVTGTNGKTTTVSMLTEILKKGGFPAKACGNIGLPIVELCEEEETLAVAEISSFQLETLNSLRPHVAVVLNITEDHLNRHYTMENYVFLKSKLLKNLTETEYAVLNYDDPTVRSFAEKTRAKTLYFSVRERVAGAYLENGELYFGKEKLLSASELPAGGVHTLQNALAAIVAAKIMGVKTQAIVEALTSFKGIKHRIEEVGSYRGVRFVNDSKGTNVDATLKAIATMEQETVLLLGGKDKGYDYQKLFSALSGSKVVHAVLYGENRYALYKSARSCRFEAFTLCDGFDFAVRVALLKAKAGQTVLLSPASASFDEFASYEQRGERFVERLQEWNKEEAYAALDEEIERNDELSDDKAEE